MKISELKQLIANLPDDMETAVCHSESGEWDGVKGELRVKSSDCYSHGAGVGMVDGEPSFIISTD